MAKQFKGKTAFHLPSTYFPENAIFLDEGENAEQPFKIIMHCSREHKLFKHAKKGRCQNHYQVLEIRDFPVWEAILDAMLNCTKWSRSWHSIYP